eukprot:6701864-Prymnesium_polylepis.1
MRPTRQPSPLRSERWRRRHALQAQPPWWRASQQHALWTRMPQLPKRPRFLSTGRRPTPGAGGCDTTARSCTHCSTAAPSTRRAPASGPRQSHTGASANWPRPTEALGRPRSGTRRQARTSIGTSAEVARMPPDEGQSVLRSAELVSENEEQARRAARRESSIS